MPEHRLNQFCQLWLMPVYLPHKDSEVKLYNDLQTWLDRRPQFCDYALSLPHAERYFQLGLAMTFAKFHWTLYTHPADGETVLAFARQADYSKNEFHQFLQAYTRNYPHV